MTRIYQAFLFLILLLIPVNSRAQSSLIEIALQIRPAIVEIRATRTELLASPNAQAAIDPIHQKMYIARRIRAASIEKGGAGVIVDPRGFIVTNVHTIGFADKIAVILSDDTILGAEILRIIPEDDLALLKVEPPFPLTAIPLSDSNYIELGEEVMNIGNSSLLKDTISAGHIIGIGSVYCPEMPNNKCVELIRLNIPIYSGDSGGPVINKNGFLVGMMVAKYIREEGVSLAIPSNKIRTLYQGFIN